MRRLTKDQIITLIAMLLAGLIGLVTGVLIDANAVKAAGPCTMGFSYNHASGRVTVYNSPYRAAGNKFTVVRTNGDDSKPQVFTPRVGSGVVTPVTVRYSGVPYGAYKLYGWRKFGTRWLPCAGTPKVFGEVG